MRDYTNLIKRKISALEILIKKADADYVSSSNGKDNEIVVWMRLQPKLDKTNIKEISKTKFNLDDADAERLFNRAYPDGFSERDNKIIRDINSVINTTNIVDKSNISDFLDDVINSIIDELAPDDIEIKYGIEDGTFLIILMLLVEEILQNKNIRPMA